MTRWVEVSDQLTAPPPFRFVYLVGSGGRTKIGQSQTPGLRVRNIVAVAGLVGNVDCFYLHGWYDGPKLERLLHKQFSAARLSGEWFDIEVNSVIRDADLAEIPRLDCPDPDAPEFNEWVQEEDQRRDAGQQQLFAHFGIAPPVRRQRDQMSDAEMVRASLLAQYFERDCKELGYLQAVEMLGSTSEPTEQTAKIIQFLYDWSGRVAAHMAGRTPKD